MTETVEVPVDDLREMITDYHTLVERVREYGLDWDSTLAWELVDAYLPPQRVPVTKHTAWGTRVLFKCNDNRGGFFVGPVPGDEGSFVATRENGALMHCSYAHWRVAPEPIEPQRVPVAVGQTRRSDGRSGQVLEVGSTVAKVGWFDNTVTWHPRSVVEGWELIQ